VSRKPRPEDEDYLEPRNEVEALIRNEEYKADPGKFIQECLSVVDGLKSGAVIPFELNPGQKVCTEALKQELAKGEFVRLIILKSRRQGISTWAEAVMYWIASCFENRTTLVLAHDKDTSKELFNMAQGFYDDDKRHESGLMPSLLTASRSSLRFGNPDKKTRHVNPGLRSSMLVETAEGRGVGRGFTLAGYHWAEVAYTQKQGVAAGLNIACSKANGTVGIWESTANGVGDAFEKNWLEAVAGRNDFRPIFLPWNIDPNCSRRLTNEERENWRYEPGEEELVQKYGLTRGQLKFRRITIASPECHLAGVPPEEVFRQEYPLCWQEAFLKRGKNFFLMSAVNDLRDSAKGEKSPSYSAQVACPLDAVELAQRQKQMNSKPILPLLKKVGYGALQVWEDPHPNEDYVISGDAAEGLQHGDNSIAIVFARKRPRVVARYSTRAHDPDEFGIICAMLGWWYNTALVGIERNGPGVAANKSLRQVHYPRAWYDRDTIGLNETVKSFMGWNTNAQNRRPMLDRLEEAIRNKEYEQPSANFYEEARTFIIVEMQNSAGASRGKPTASPGCHDDEIMANAIALQLHLHGGAIRGEVAKPNGKYEVNIYAPVPSPERKPSQPSAYEWF
jgi:hypothetical protein